MNNIYNYREQRAQQRYSVEVANAGNYLNIRPSTLETLTKSGNSSILNRRFRKNGNDVSFFFCRHLKLKSYSLIMIIIYIVWHLVWEQPYQRSSEAAFLP